MPLRFFPITISSRIRWYSIIMVGVPLLFMTIMLIFFIKSAIFKATRQELEEQVTSHKIVIEEWFRERSSDVKFLAESESLRSGKLSQITPLLNLYDDTHDDISEVIWVGPDGTTRSHESIHSPTAIGIRDREYFTKCQADPTLVPKIIVSESLDDPIILFSHPVTLQNGSFGGVVFLAARLTAINRLMKNLWFGKTGETYIINREGYMLTESRFLDELKSARRVKDTAIMVIKTNTKNIESALVGTQPEGAYLDYRGAEVLGASQWVKAGPWLIVSEIDYKEVMDPIYSFLWTAIGGAFLTLLIITPFSIKLIQSISIPLKRLSSVARQMTEGKFDCECTGTGVSHPPEEVTQLIDGFCAMQGKVDRTVQELQKSAVTDQLTGLPNRRYLMKEGTRLVDIAIRAGQPCSLMIMDIDHFKVINDTYGHTVGDIVLQQISKAFQEVVRSSDIIARYGGEEFVVVAPGSDIDSGRTLAERLRQSVEARIFNNDEQPLTCTISIGVSHYATDIKFGVDAYEDMLARADNALYKAKDTGRNRICIAEPHNKLTDSPKGDD
ncbi:sensor domain-containing diguanylate cyclase [Maridesulfovibrio salexigens]|uniref:diguanylate cyclase n=1 Tax=Maridesulfovibrio salexigens (strain ATCC 14822 / DSM 2638 / NCIMB 8403 / VKM B-1763) TaxID=526222 RepID=C6BW86_MARSD|nr:sensor domain-containing diguanylate cyclase [Maridesulfovibrio salexigens]ACS78330.1 diguanylate cyclase [Maridesulfovibrio salexigens DSM 2638]